MENKPGICTYCHEICEVRLMDFGIGAYEFWGARGFQIDLVAVSDCCEAPARDFVGILITVDDFLSRFEPEFEN